MRKFHLILIALIILACGKETTSLKIMSFNIRYNNPADGENIWSNRKDNVGSMIRFHDADVAGLQEALKDQIHDLELMLPEYGWYGLGRDDGKEAGEHMVVFYKTDRLFLLDKGTFWLSQTPDLPSKGWDAGSYRTVTWCKFRDKLAGTIFFHFNTHFDNAGQEARKESAKLLLTKMTELAGDFPLIVTGDFNSLPDSDVYAILTSEAEEESTGNLSDALRLSQYEHHGPTGTWTGFNEVTPANRIDYIFIKGNVRVLRHGFLSDTFDNRFPSDHLPVLAEVTIR